MSILRRFIPFITFVLVSGAAGWQLGLLAGLVAELISIAATRPFRVGVLDGGMLAFFAVMGAFSLAQPHSPVQDYVADVSMAWLAAVSLVSVAVNRPFTMDFARDRVSPEVARSSAFLRINRTITLAWAGAFTASAVVGPILVAADRPVLARLARIGLIVWAAKFSSDYPDRVRDEPTPSNPIAVGHPSPPRP